MSSAAFSVPNGSQPKISLNRRGQRPSTATSSAADEAIQQILDARRRRNKYGSEPERRESALGGAIGSVTDTIGESVSRLGVVRFVLTAVVLVAIGGVLFAGAVMARPIPRHSIAGTAMIDGKPLGRVTLVFHGKDADGEAFMQAVFTAADGTFRNDPTVGIPAGSYAIVVDGGPSPRGKAGSAKGGVPARYRDPSTTPIRVEIAGDTTALQVSASRK
jgi:hypothetical protein